MTDKKKTTYFQQWMTGIPYELAFWNNMYRWDRTFEGVQAWSRLGKELELEGMDAQAFLSAFDAPVVLDVGCGLSYAKGDHLRTSEGLVPIDVRYVDPLAHFYNQIKQRHHREMPDIQFGMMEYLTAVADPGTVALVIIHNALDHSANPMKGILSALKVLKTGGCLYLNHHPDEAEAERYKGFHKFNICTDEHNRCIIWNKDERIVVDDVVAPFAEVSTHTLDENGFVVTIITKTKDVDDEAVGLQTDNREQTRLLASLIDECMNLRTSFGMRMKYWWYNTIQFFVQSLSHENRMKLRKIVYRK